MTAAHQTRVSVVGGKPAALTRHHPGGTDGEVQELEEGPARGTAGHEATRTAVGTQQAAAKPQDRTDRATAGDTARRLSAGQQVIAAAMTEDRGPNSLDANVCKLVDDLGLWSFHVEKSLDVAKGRKNVSQRGWPDRVILGPQGGLFRELKSAKGKPTPEQREVGARLTAAGFDWDIWTPMDLLSGRIQSELIAISGMGRRA